MSKKILGLDIRKESVAAVLANIGLKSNRIEALAFIPVSDQAENGDSLVPAIEDLVGQMDLKDATCIASFPADRILFRNIKLPFKQQKKIKQILPFELEPILPVPVENLIIDFNAIETDPTDTNTDLLTASVNREYLETFINQLTRFQIDPIIITPGGYSQAQCLLNLMDIPENSVFLDIDTSQTTIVLIAGGKVQLIRSIPAGLIDHSNPSSLCLNVQHTISGFIESTRTDYQPDRFYFTGKGLGQNGFEKKITDYFDVPSQSLDLMRESDPEISNQSDLPWLPEEMNNALALTFSEMTGFKTLNFRKGPFRVAKQWAEHKKSIVVTGILVGVLMISLLVNSMIGFYGKKTRLAKIQNQTEAVFKSIFPDVKMDAKQPGSQMMGLVDAKKRESRSLRDSGPHIRMIDLLNDISTRVPKSIDVELTQMVLGDENISISGNTDTFNSVDEMKVQLEKSERFKTVTIVSTNKDKKGNRIRFKLKLLL